MKKAIAYLCLLLTLLNSCSNTKKVEGNETLPKKTSIEKGKEAKWKRTWSDEFNYSGLPDSSKWGYDVGGHGWGNNELQFYTKADTSNAIVANGILKIIARKQIIENKQYTSARLLTKDKAEFKYGKIEVRAKLPAGKGTWSAIWMLGSNVSKVGWPLSGEIDIMEHVGYEKTVSTGRFIQRLIIITLTLRK